MPDNPNPSYSGKLLLWLTLAAGILAAMFVYSSPPHLSAQDPVNPVQQDAVARTIPPPLCSSPTLDAVVNLVRLCVPVDDDAVCKSAGEGGLKIGARQLSSGSHHYQYVCFSVGSVGSIPACAQNSSAKISESFDLYEWDKTNEALGPIPSDETNADCEENLITTVFDCETAYGSSFSDYEGLTWSDVSGGNSPLNYCRAKPVEPARKCSDSAFIPAEYIGSEVRCYQQSATQAIEQGCPVGHLILKELDAAIDSTQLVRADSQTHFGLGNPNPASFCLEYRSRPIRCNPLGLEENEIVALGASGMCHILFNRQFNSASGTGLPCEGDFQPVNELFCIKPSPHGTEPGSCEGSIMTDLVRILVDEHSSPFSDQMNGDPMPIGWAHFEFLYPLALVILDDDGNPSAAGKNARWIVDFTSTDAIEEDALVCGRAFDAYAGEYARSSGYVDQDCDRAADEQRIDIPLDLRSESPGTLHGTLIARDTQGQVPVTTLCLVQIDRPETGCPTLTGDLQQFEVDTDDFIAGLTPERPDSCFELRERTYVCADGYELLESVVQGPTCRDGVGDSYKPDRLSPCPQGFSSTIIQQNPGVYTVGNSFGETPVQDQRCGKWRSYIPCIAASPMSINTKRCGSTTLTENNLQDCINGGNADTSGNGDRVWLTADFDSSPDTSGSADICVKLPPALCEDASTGIKIFTVFHARCYRKSQPRCPTPLQLVVKPAVLPALEDEAVCAAEVTVLLGCDQNPIYPVLDAVSQKCIPDEGVSLVCSIGRTYNTDTGHCERVISSYPVDIECTGEFNVVLDEEYCGKRNKPADTYECAEGLLHVKRSPQSSVMCYLPAEYGPCESSMGDSESEATGRVLYIDYENTRSIGDTGITVKAPNIVYCAEVTSSLVCAGDTGSVLNLRFDGVLGLHCAFDDDSGRTEQAGPANPDANPECPAGDVRMVIEEAPNHIFDALGIETLKNYDSGGQLFCFALSQTVDINAAPECPRILTDIPKVLVDTNGQNPGRSSWTPGNGFVDTCYTVYPVDECADPDSTSLNLQSCADINKYSSISCSEFLYNGRAVADVLDMRIFYNTAEANLCTRYADLSYPPDHCTGETGYAFLQKDWIGTSPVFYPANPEFEAYLPLREALLDGICGLLIKNADLSCVPTSSEPVFLYIFGRDLLNREDGCYERRPGTANCQVDFSYIPARGECVYDYESDTDTTPEISSLQCLVGPVATEAAVTRELESLIRLTKTTHFSSSLNRFLVDHPVEISISFSDFDCEISGTSDAVTYRAHQILIDMKELRPLASEEDKNIITDSAVKEDVDGLGLWDDYLNGDSEARECLSRSIYGETNDISVLSCEQPEAGAAVWGQIIEDSSNCEVSPTSKCFTQASTEMSCRTSTDVERLKNTLTYDSIEKVVSRNYCFPRPTWYETSVIFIWESGTGDSRITLTHQVEFVISVGELISVARLQE